MKDRKIISTHLLTKTYKKHLFRKECQALQGVELQVNKGEVFGIVGANGAGKSTLIKILMGFVQADSGHVLLNQKKPTSEVSRTSVGYLPEASCLYSNLTIYDHLVFVATVLQMPNSHKNITTMLDKVGILHVAKKPISTYSKGMKQRAALAYALFREPDIFILDEPMSGLDPMGRQLVVDLIEEYHEKEHTILFCSHILTDVERMCDRIGIMDKGKMITIIESDDLSKNKHPIKKIASPLEKLFFKTINHQGNRS